LGTGSQKEDAGASLLFHEARVMTQFLSQFANRLRARAATRRERHLKRAVEQTKTYEEKTSRDWQGEPLSLHQVPLVGKRNPRGRDGRRL
jgi:hypothetical protein